MYLSMLHLNIRHRQVRKDVANPYSMHQTLAHVLGTEQRTLWRLEQGEVFDEYNLLVQTTQPPDWQALLNRFPGYAEPAEGTPKLFDPQLREGQLLRFRLYANPTVSREGKRQGLYREEEQLDWLASRLMRAGAQPRQVIVSRRGRLRIPKSPQAAVLAVGQFDGVLRVEDPDQLLNAIRHGIGHGKAFGLGLLSLARYVE